MSYPYLWAWQQQRGETEGRKQRPVCVVVAIRSASDGNTHLVLLAITTQPPQAERIALEIPDIERRRAGIGGLKQSWVVVDEYNHDIVEHSWCIEPHQEARSLQQILRDEDRRDVRESAKPVGSRQAVRLT